MAQQPHFAIQVATPPTSEPVTVQEAADWMRIDSDDGDEMILSMISAARELVEAETGRALMPTVYRMAMDRFPLLPNSQYSPGNPNAVTPVLQNTWPLDGSAWAILIPRAPLISVTSIQYYDVTGTLQTLDASNYIVDSSSEPPRIAPTNGGFWPGCQFRPGAVRVNFTAGFATADLVPSTLKAAIKMLAAYWYDNPNAASEKLEEQPMAVRSMIAMNRVAAVW